MNSVYDYSWFPEQVRSDDCTCKVFFVANVYMKTSKIIAEWCTTNIWITKIQHQKIVISLRGLQNPGFKGLINMLCNNI